MSQLKRDEILAEFEAFVERQESRTEQRFTPKALEAFRLALDALEDILDDRSVPASLKVYRSWVTATVPEAPLSPQVQIINVGMAESRSITGRNLPRGSRAELVVTPWGRYCGVRLVTNDHEPVEGNFSKTDIAALMEWVNR